MPEAYDGDWMDRERDEISQLRETMKSEREREREIESYKLCQWQVRLDRERYING